MKTLVSFLMLIFVSFNVIASNGDGGNDTTLNKNAVNIHPSILRNQLDADLTTGVWIQQTNTMSSSTAKISLQFNPFGAADIISVGEDGSTVYKTKLWRTTVIDGQVMIFMTDVATHKDELFTLGYSGKDIVLTDVVSKKAIHLTFKPFASNEDFDLMRADFVGTWDNAHYPFDINNGFAGCGTLEEMKGAYLHYEFGADGSYTKVVGNDKKEILEKGYWEVSKDGQYLKMLSASNGAQLQVAKIKRLGNGRMTIEQALISPNNETTFCTAFKAFSFNKTKNKNL